MATCLVGVMSRTRASYLQLVVATSSALHT